MSTGAIVILELVGALIIALQSVMRVNRMTRATRLSYCAAWILAGGSSAAIAAGILSGAASPNIYSATLLISIALVASLDRRRTP